MSRKAFTLIELLVVIAIIGLLMSIIVPALRRVKQQATGAVCLANVKGLSASWHAYLMDNNEYLVPGHVPRESNRDAGVTYWIESPQTDAGEYRGEEADVTLEYEQNGIRKGSLFPYIEALDVYHCSGDKSAQNPNFTNPTGNKPWFNSYSISGLMNGRITSPIELISKVVNRSTKIVNPSGKVVFVENTDERGWLMGYWMMYPGDVPYWADSIAIWHRDRSSLGFADGHAETHQWIDNTTIENAKAGSVIYSRPSVEESGDDISFVNCAYIPGRR